MSRPDLRLGRWQDVLADVECDLLCTDTPYSERTHAGHDTVQERDDGWLTRSSIRKAPLQYGYWTPDDVHAFVAHWSPRTRGWFATLTDHVLARAWEEALLAAGRWVAPPVPCCISGMTVRLCGGGPSSEAVYLVLGRPRTREFAQWPTTRGFYHVPRERQLVTGGKPLRLVLAIVRDYSRPGELVCDPCAGGGTTLRAADIERRRGVGAECDPETFAKASARLGRGFTPTLPLELA